MSKEIKIFTRQLSLANVPSDEEHTMAVRRLNHAVLYVNGLEREVGFYTRTLGFEVRTQIPGRAAFLRSPGSVNDHDLGLFEIGAGHASGLPEIGLYHLAWEVGTLAELVEARRKLQDAGALVGESDHRVSKSLYAKDPSGIEFEVMWRVPVEDWESEVAQGGASTAPLDWDRTLARWDTHRETGAATGSPT
jgi:catechol-2,3-dioxygenase